VSIRTQRIAEQIRGELDRLLREETHDPRIGLVTITRVKVSPDLSTALVFWSPLDVDGEADPDEIGDGLASAAGFLRGRIGAALPLRKTPELHFRFDPSIREGARVLALLRSLPEIRADAERAGEEKETTASGADPEGAKAHGEET
jgi:ribosome-binding factor A